MQYLSLKKNTKQRHTSIVNCQKKYLCHLSFLVSHSRNCSTALPNQSYFQVNLFNTFLSLSYDWLKWAVSRSENSWGGSHVIKAILRMAFFIESFTLNQNEKQEKNARARETDKKMNEWSNLKAIKYVKQQHMCKENII